MTKIGSGRNAYTRVLALARLGRLSTARTILVGAAGDAESVKGESSEIRSWKARPRLPMGDSAALEATAFFLRSMPGYATDGPEPIDDLREAVRLAPNSPIVHFALSQRLSDRRRLPEALDEADRAEGLATGKDAEIYRVEVAALRERLALGNPRKRGRWLAATKPKAK